jgi:hypothetical protein
LRQPKGYRNQYTVLRESPPSFSLVCTSDYALIDVEHLRAGPQILEILECSDLPLEESLLLVELLPNHTQHSELHPKDLSKVFSHSGSANLYRKLFLQALKYVWHENRPLAFLDE